PLVASGCREHSVRRERHAETTVELPVIRDSWLPGCSVNELDWASLSAHRKITPGRVECERMRGFSDLPPTLDLDFRNVLPDPLECFRVPHFQGVSVLVCHDEIAIEAVRDAPDSFGCALGGFTVSALWVVPEFEPRSFGSAIGGCDGFAIGTDRQRSI